MSSKEVIKKLNALYFELGKNLPKFKRELGKYIKLGRESGDFFLIGASYYFLALANWRNGGERDSVLLCAIKATAMLDMTKHYRMIARCHNMLGIAYLGQENYQMALESYMRTYQIAKTHKSCSTDDRLMTLNNIADCYYEMGDYKMSYKQFRRCIDEGLAKSPDNHNNIALYSLNLANLCLTVGNYEEGLSVLDAIADWVDELSLKMWTGLYYSVRACILYAMGRIEDGNFCADRSLAVIDEDTDTYEFHKEFESIAHALIDVGDYERAMKFADILTDYSEKSGHTIDRLMSCRVTAHYYNSLGDRSGSLKKYEELDALYKKRMVENKAMQLTIHKKINEAGREIAKLNKTIKRNAESAAKDPLSGLLNRASLLAASNEFIGLASKKNERFGAVFLDIDFFKECNDTYGHARGDEVIKLVAKLCLQEESSCVKFARYGGDEFFGITHGLGTESVADIARRICSNLRKADIPNVRSPKGGRITVSAGVVNVKMTEGTDTIIDVINAADKALYHAKESGRDTIFLYNAELSDDEPAERRFIGIDYGEQ